MNRDKGKASADASFAPGYAIVMTDEQVEVLGKQISIYAAICEQLVEMYHAHVGRQGSIAGAWPGSDPVMVHAGKTFAARKRWAPTKMQWETLENVFSQGDGTVPDRQQVKEITANLSQHGRISETNVYNWFQNRRARGKRLKRKQAEEASRPNNDEPEEDEARSSSSTM